GTTATGYRNRGAPAVSAVGGLARLTGPWGPAQLTQRRHAGLENLRRVPGPRSWPATLGEAWDQSAWPVGRRTPLRQPTCGSGREQARLGRSSVPRPGCLVGGSPGPLHSRRFWAARHRGAPPRVEKPTPPEAPEGGRGPEAPRAPLLPEVGRAF